MIVSHALKFIFVSNPKVASTSIERAFAPFHDEERLNECEKHGLYTKRHMPAIEIREKLSPEIWKSYFKIACVRNPWSWFVSQYFYNLAKRGGARADATHISRQDILDMYEYLKNYRGVPWVESGCQHAFVCDRAGNPIVDRVTRYENISEEIQAVASRLGVQVKLLHLNRSDHHDYTDYYTEETASLIKRLYSRDIALFEYSFPTEYEPN